MKSFGRVLLAAVACTLLGGCVVTQQDTMAQGAPTARAQLADTSGRTMGEANLREGTNGVHVQVRLENAPIGLRAIHVHETGRCRPTFEAAGAHWNPNGRQHGFLSAEGPHLGDLPNIHVAENGRGQAEFFLQGARLSGDGRGLLDGDGSALVVHERADDHRTNPSGNSGDRVLCGVIVR